MPNGFEIVALSVQSTRY